ELRREANGPGLKYGFRIKSVLPRKLHQHGRAGCPDGEESLHEGLAVNRIFNRHNLMAEALAELCYIFDSRFHSGVRLIAEIVFRVESNVEALLARPFDTVDRREPRALRLHLGDGKQSLAVP